jgi:ABC-type cobalamin/Fe3+-siderophores transport system ATPase subunit
MRDGLIWAQGAPADVLGDEMLAELYGMPVATVKLRRAEAILV